MNITAALPSLDQMVEAVLTSLDDDKAQDILTIDLVGKTSIADRMIIASGTSSHDWPSTMAAVMSAPPRPMENAPRPPCEL